jgi:hypothetical protein
MLSAMVLASAQGVIGTRGSVKANENTMITGQ